MCGRVEPWWSKRAHNHTLVQRSWEEDDKRVPIGHSLVVAQSSWGSGKVGGGERQRASAHHTPMLPYKAAGKPGKWEGGVRQPESAGCTPTLPYNAPGDWRVGGGERRRGSAMGTPTLPQNAAGDP